MCLNTLRGLPPTKFMEALSKIEGRKMKEIKCPHCGYDGSDLWIGRQPIGIDISGIPRILCSKCGRYFIVKGGER